jgi:23S rRNA pseudouridine1911/1915/1917 synthase
MEKEETILNSQVDLLRAQVNNVRTSVEQTELELANAAEQKKGRLISLRMIPSVVYEDHDLLVINKPAGLLTHPINRKDRSESVVGWLIKKYPEISKVRDQEGAHFGQWVDLRPGIVHRLDRDTSGLLIIAKNQKSFDYLKKEFQKRGIKKTYLALVFGQLKNGEGKIESPIAKLKNKQTTQIHGKQELKEKSAITKYKVIGKYNLNNSTYNLLQIEPLTGRTHQIRIHLKSIGHPVVCDPLYSPKKSVCPAKLGRLFLHAWKLFFTTPSGKALSLEVDLPQELEDFITGLSKISE